MNNILPEMKIHQIRLKEDKTVQKREISALEHRNKIYQI